MISISIILVYATGFICALAGLHFKQQKLKDIANWLTVLGFILHSMLLISALFNSPDAVDNSAATLGEALTKGYYLQLLSWIVVLLYFIFRQRPDLRLLSITTIPLALLLFSLSFKVAKIKSDLPPALSKLFLHMHIGSFFFSFALLAMGFGAGVFFLYSEKKIKKKKSLRTELPPDLPALSSCDKVNHLAVIFGFPLYTVGLISGFIWAGPTWGETLSGDVKELISIFNWLIFAILFHQRLVKGLRGRKAAILLIIVFGVAATSLLSNFFVESHHSFFTINNYQ